MNAREILQKAAEKLGSYNKLAGVLGISQAAVSEMKTGGVSVSPFRAAQAADVLGKDSTKAAFQALADQARTPKERDYWLSKISILWFVAMSAFHSGSAEAKYQLIEAKQQQYTLYIIIYG